MLVFYSPSAPFRISFHRIWFDRGKTDVSKANFAEAYFSKGYLQGKFLYVYLRHRLPELFGARVKGSLTFHKMRSAT